MKKIVVSLTPIRFPLLLTLLLLLLVLPATGEAQSKTYYWQQFDVDVEVLENGDLRVTEHQLLNFSGEPFTFGFRNIPTGRNGNNDGIEDVRVSEGDTVYQQSSSEQPYTFEVNRSGGEAVIYWYFPPAIGSNSYTISYLVKSAVRTEESGDQVFWNALPSDLGARVENSVINIYLPPGIEAASTTALWNGLENDAVTTSVSADAQRVTFQILQPRPAGTTVEVGARFPSGQLQLSTPAWQRAEQIADVFGLILLVLSLLLAIGGPLAALLLWYLRGRDPEIGPVPDYITEPPDNTPPAVVGTLIDETANIHDIMSTLIDLARRGYLTMTEKPGKEYEFARTEKKIDDLRPFERKMMTGLFEGRQSRDLDDLQYRFSSRLPAIRTDLYKELEQRGLVKRSPESVRNRYGCLAIGIGVLAFGSIFALGAIFSEGVGTLFCVPIALGLTAVALFIVSRFMPAKTQKGAEAAALWLAFKKYLSDIERYTNLEDAKEIFERYLPYAVAFGLERSWIRKFSSVPGTPIPPWYFPYPYYGYGGPRGGTMSSGGERAPGGGRPSLEGMSGGFSGGLAAMSGGLTRMLTNTQTVLQSTRPSSSSGGGGGFSGGFSGGSSGGGGGGFG